MLTPYYQDEQAVIYCGDVADVINELDRYWFDVVIADPPYGQTSLRWDKWVPGWPARTYDLAKQYKASLWCFGSLRMFMDHVTEFADWQQAQDLIWEKHNGSSFLNDRFRRVHEQIAHFYPRGVAWDDIYHRPVLVSGGSRKTVRRSKSRPTHLGSLERGAYLSEDGGARLMRSVILAKSTHGYAVHPTQKPEAIIAPLLTYSCPPGGVVLDLFGGAGSTTVTAKQLGMRSVMIEIDPAHCKSARDRLMQGILL